MSKYRTYGIRFPVNVGGMLPNTDGQKQEMGGKFNSVVVPHILYVREEMHIVKIVLDL